MNESEFWQVIESVRVVSTQERERPLKLKEILNTKNEGDIIEFAEIYNDLIIKAYTWPLWGAAYVISGGCSDDGFDYFRDWLISEGQDTYEKALKDPESLSELEDIKEPELEQFRYAAYDVYKEKTGNAIELREREYPQEPAGTEWNEDTVDSFYPKLARKYW